MDEQEVEEALEELAVEGLVEVVEPPKLELEVKRKVSLDINASIELPGGQRITVKQLKDGAKLTYSRKVKQGYYSSRTESESVTIPNDFVKYALEVLQAVVLAQDESAS